MTHALWIIPAAVLLALALVGIGWRYASRVWQLPCPSLFAWSLEGSLYDKWLKTSATLDCLELRPGMRVLEIGPGPGRLLIPAAARVQPGGEAVGLDIQPGMIERLQRRAQAAGVGNLRAVLGNAEQAHFPPESFDVVFLCTALGEIPDRCAAIRHAASYLKPGGLLSLTELAADPHYQSQATVRRLCEEAGLQFERVIGPRWFYTANFRRPQGSASPES